jgi:hypothetical protein
MKIASTDGDHVRTIYTGKSARFAAYLVHYEIDQVPQEPPPLVQTNEPRVPDSCKLTMERVSVIEGMAEGRGMETGHTNGSDVDEHKRTRIVMIIVLLFPVI